MFYLAHIEQLKKCSECLEVLHYLTNISHFVDNDFCSFVSAVQSDSD